MAEIYVPFSWFEPMWLENLGFADAERRRLEAHRVRRDRDRRQAARSTARAACSRRTRSAPRACSASREAALQVRGAAGEHQVDGARKALGHAYGGGSQFFAMWVVGAEKPSN